LVGFEVVDDFLDYVKGANNIEGQKNNHRNEERNDNPSFFAFAPSVISAPGGESRRNVKDHENRKCGGDGPTNEMKEGEIPIQNYFVGSTNYK